MIAFEIWIDGQRTCTAGVTPSGVTSVVATWVRRPAHDAESGEPVGDRFEEELTLDVGGLTHDPDGAAVHVGWLRQPLRPGQRITVAVVETEAADPPRHRDREDPVWAAQRKREYYERLKARPRVTSFAPQFLVDDLARSIAYYENLGFTFDEPWDGFYAIGHLDGLELHLKEAPKSAAERRHRREHGHLDAAAGVDGIEAFYARCTGNGAQVVKPLTATAWGTMDFYIEDPDGYIVSFGGRPASVP